MGLGHPEATILEAGSVNEVRIWIDTSKAAEGVYDYGIIDYRNNKKVGHGSGSTLHEAKEATKDDRYKMAMYASRFSIHEGSRTPWGHPPATAASPLHGNKDVDPAWRNSNGWYEEDTEWSVAHTPEQLIRSPAGDLRCGLRPLPDSVDTVTAPSTARNIVARSVAGDRRSLRCTRGNRNSAGSGLSPHVITKWNHQSADGGTSVIWPSAASQNGTSMPKRIFRSSAAVLAIVAMAAMTAGCGSPESPSAAPAAVSSPSPTPTILPVPDGCPPAKELGQAWDGKPDLFTTIDATLLDSELNTPLPKNGCAYLYGQAVKANNSSDQAQHVMVWYFNTNRPGRATTSDITAWAKTAGGTPLTVTDPGTSNLTKDNSGHDFDLPDTFSGWSKSTVVQSIDESSSFGWNQSVLPAYTQGTQSKIYFSVYADKAQAILKASGAASDAGTSTSDPTKALSQGLTAAFSTSTTVTDDQGYTAQLKVQGKLEPFTKDVKEAPPGQLNAVSSSTVTGSVTNTTAGRQTKTPEAQVVAVYALDSAACTNYNGISVKGADWQKSSFCQINLGYVEGVSLAPNGDQTLKGSTGPQKLGTFPESGNAVAQLNSPLSIYLSFGSKGNVQVGVTWHGDKGCMASRASASDSWFVAMDGWPDVICK